MLTGKHILVVEDNEHLRAILATTLGHFGCDPVLVGSGAEAINSVLAKRPDLVLLDLGLPDMHGHNVAQAILHAPGCANIPIIGFSAYSADEERRNAFKAGMVGYIQKPIQAETIKQSIERFL